MSDHAALAERLLAAARDGRRVPPPGVPDGEGYAVQRALRAAMVRAGDAPAGWKVGMTAPDVAGGPIYGELMASMVLDDGASIPDGELIDPDVEGEIAFVLDRELRGPGVTRDDALAATRGVRPAIEVIAGRLEGKAGLEDCLADNAFSARAVLGALVPADGIDLRLVGMAQWRAPGPPSGGRELVRTGAGARVMGDPAGSVAWLANALAESGERLPAGSFVMTGSVAPPVRARCGDVFTVEFDRLGSVSVTFASRDERRA